MWGDGDLNRKKTLFGDTFGMRTDYTLGTFYRGRMQFLADSEEHNILEPPATFKTKRQAQNALKEKQITFQKLSFPKKEQEGEHAPVKSISKKVAEGTKKQIQKKQSNQQPVVYLPTIADFNQDDWVEERQAGCRMWVNHVTGDVSHDCPWGDAESKGESTRTSSAGAKGEDSDDFGGTGALVYDSAEIDALLNIFDAKKT